MWRLCFPKLVYFLFKLVLNLSSKQIGICSVFSNVNNQVGFRPSIVASLIKFNKRSTQQNQQIQSDLRIFPKIFPYIYAHTKDWWKRVFFISFGVSQNAAGRKHMRVLYEVKTYKFNFIANINIVHRRSLLPTPLYWNGVE